MKMENSPNYVQFNTKKNFRLQNINLNLQYIIETDNFINKFKQFIIDFHTHWTKFRKPVYLHISMTFQNKSHKEI